MKDITIKGSRIKKELIVLAVCLVAAILLNVYAIAKYDTDWSELIGQLHIVVGVALIIYVLVLVFRLLFMGLSRLIKMK